MLKATMLVVLLGQWTTSGILMKDEGVAKGYSKSVNCIGAGIVCGLTSGVWTITASGGGSFAPIGAQYVTLAADATLTNEAVVPTCAGTNKLTFNGSALSCAADQDTLPPTLPLSAANGGLGQAQPTCAGTNKLTCNGTTCSCAVDQDTVYTLPAASTTLGGVKMAAACGAGNHVASIGAGGELTCTADAGGGGGADALGRYIVQIATNAPVNAQVMASLGTGLMKNTTTTGVVSIAASGTDYGPPTSGNATGLVISTTTTGAHTAYAGTSCTNQFPRSLNASGAATCAGIGVADFTANQGTTVQVLHGNAAGQPTWGQIAVADHSATGTPSATTYYRGDNTWSTPSGGGGVGTLTRLTATWASSATINTLGIIGAGGVPLTSPTITANAPFAARCVISMTRPATTNGPRYGVTASQTLTRVALHGSLSLAGTAPAYTESLQRTTAVTAGTCTSGCTAAMTATLAAVMQDEIEIIGQMGGTAGTVSLQAAPSAGALNTAQIGSYCIWY